MRGEGRRGIISVMATRTAPSRRELELLVAEFRHVRSEHERAGPGGSVRRHLHTRLLHLSERFDRLLEEWVPGEETREAWRACLHHGAPAPAEPRESPPALVFKGRSEAGAVAEVRERPDGDYDVVVDGGLLERVALGAGLEAGILRLDGLEFREVFGASRAALEAAAFFAGEGGAPPWEHARELVADGIVDATFALTPRGRRALARETRR